MKKFFIASIVLLGLCGNGAVAADSRAFWQGVYAGVHAGGTSVSSNFDDLSFIDSTATRDRGGVLGALAGINFVQGNWLGGFEADIGFTSAKSSDPIFGIDSKLNWAGNLRVRTGVIVDRSLFFIAGGLAFANVQQQAYTFFPVALPRQTYFAYGLTIGAGVETRIADNWLFRVEYLYTQYQPFDQVYSELGAQVTTRIDAQTARAALIYKFPAGGGTAPQAANTGPANWSGFYVGGHAGSLGMSELHQSGEPFFFPYDDRVKDRGLWGGGLVGVNVQLMRWVFGLELDFGLGRVSGWDSQDNIAARMLWDAHIRARIGYSFDRYLVFMTTGVALAQLQQEDFFSPGVRTNGLFGGYTIGGGIDMLLAPNFIFRVEYLHSRFETSTIINTASATILDTNLSTNTVRAAIIYKYEGSGFGSPAVTPPSSMRWSGLYGGVFAGYQTFKPHLEVFITVDDFTAKDFAGGLLFGVNYQAGNWVIGVEADAGRSGAKVRQFSACLCYEIETKPIIETNWRARLGYAFDRYLVFGTAGIAVAQFEQNAIGIGTKRRAHTGFTFGGGIDAAFTNNLIGRLEYLFTEYNLQNYNYYANDPLGPMADSTYQTQIWRAALIYKFNP